MAERKNPSLFKPGQSGNPKGKPKGTKNKLTKDVKEMIEKALHNAGGVDYLEAQARENPKAFMALVGRIIPAKVDMDVHVVSQEIVTTLERRRQYLNTMRDVTPTEEKSNGKAH